MGARLVGVPKLKTYRSEDLRRAVTTLPCMCCGIEGHTQAAHGNQGKGLSLKASDASIAALCADRPGVRGCHALLDQGGKMGRDERREFEMQMIAATYIALIERGLLKVVR